MRPSARPSLPTRIVARSWKALLGLSQEPIRNRTRWPYSVVRSSSLDSVKVAVFPVGFLEKNRIFTRSGRQRFKGTDEVTVIVGTTLCWNARGGMISLCLCFYVYL